jgi:hypothetical protein
MLDHQWLGVVNFEPLFSKPTRTKSETNKNSNQQLNSSSNNTAIKHKAKPQSNQASR